MLHGEYEIYLHRMRISSQVLSYICDRKRQVNTGLIASDKLLTTATWRTVDYITNVILPRRAS